MRSGIKTTHWKWCKLCRNFYKSRVCNHQKGRKEAKKILEVTEEEKKTESREWDDFFA